MKFRSLLLAAALLAGTAASASNDTPPGTESATAPSSVKKDVAGGVQHAETKKPLASVTVTAYAANRKEATATTDIYGNYSFAALKPGTYRFVFEKSGYKKVVREKVVVRGDESLPLYVELVEEEDDFSFLPGALLFSDFE